MEKSKEENSLIASVFSAVGGTIGGGCEGKKRNEIYLFNFQFLRLQLFFCCG
jgi:hypothetical protein